MRQAPEHLQKLLEPVISAMNYELVGIEFVSGGHAAMLRIYIDKEDGVTIDDCEKVSHQISGVLEVEDPLQGKYNLEVSSPGLDRPLFKLEHFAQFIGSGVKVQLRSAIDGRRRFTGIIKAVSEDKVILAIDEDEQELPMNMIDRANLVPNFN